jgi:hypothetical protein
MELRWRISDSASCFHAATALAAGNPLVNVELATALQPEVAGLLLEATHLGCEGTRLLELLAMLGGEIDNNQQLATAVLKRLAGLQSTDQAAAGLSRRISSLEAAYLKICPGIAEELTLRAGPLREQWEARGPGLLTQLANLTEPRLVAEGATILLVQPVLGGFGAAYIPANIVRIEALIADASPQLPETVRLGWLLAQLNLDVPIFEGPLTRDRQFDIGRLALLPAVLAAAEKVELIRDGEAVLSQALTAWTGDSSATEALAAWWDTFCASRPVWSVALAALDQMLRENVAAAAGHGGD